MLILQHDKSSDFSDFLLYNFKLMLRKILSICLTIIILTQLSTNSTFAQTATPSPSVTGSGSGTGSGLGALQAETIEVSLGDKIILKDGTPVKDVFNSTDDMINLIVRVLFIGAGLVLFFIIIVAGFSLIKGESKDKDQAKTQITGALIGFLVMFAAYWIMQIIQLITGVGMGF
jgi:hypothetical protein